MGNLNARVDGPRVGRAQRPPVAGPQRRPRRHPRARVDRRPAGTRRRDRRPGLPRGDERDDDRGRDGPQRDPGPARGDRELPLRARPIRPPRPRPGCASCSVAADVEVEVAEQRGRRSGGDHPPPGRSGCGTSGRLDVRPKQAWTPVAEFGQAQIAGRELRPRGPGLRAPRRRAGDRGGVGRRVRAVPRVPGGGAVTHLSPGARRAEPYPFEELDRRRAAAVAAGLELIDFGVGDPRDETPAFIREALAAAIDARVVVPARGGAARAPRGDRGLGRPSVRRRAWIPTTHVLPTLGPKELVFSLAQMVVDPAGGKDLVLCTSPGYPVPERGARFAGADVRRLPLRAEAGFWPDLDAVDDATWDRTAILWLNSPNNPTGAIATLEQLTRAADVCRRHDVLLASDEAYSELWFGDVPAPSALQTGDLANVLAITHAVEALLDDGLPQRLRRGRSRRRSRRCGGCARAVGVTPQVFVQRASIAAWSDETHVEAARARYAGDARLFLDLFAEPRRRGRGADRGHVLPVGRGPGWRGLGPVRLRSGGTDRRRRGAGVVLRTGGRGVRADGDGADDGRVRARGRPAASGDPAGDGGVSDLARARSRRPGRRAHADPPGADRRRRRSVAVIDAAGHRRAPCGRARGRRLARARLGEAGGPALLPRARARDDRGRPVRVPRQAAAEARLRGDSASASCRRRPRATARTWSRAWC